MENTSLIELSLEEFRTKVTGAELIYFSGFLTRRYLENWALHGFIEPVGYNDNMRVNYTSYDYEKLEYCFGEAINYFVSQDIRYDILNKMIEKFRIEKGFSASITEKDGQESDSVPIKEEDVLAEVGKWYALEPANEAIHVGLMRLQDSSYREIYSKVFGEEVTGEFTKAMREKIRRRWCSFLNLADDRGIPKKTLEDMVSPR